MYIALWDVLLKEIYQLQSGKSGKKTDKHTVDFFTIRLFYSLHFLTVFFLGVCVCMSALTHFWDPERDL